LPGAALVLDGEQNAEEREPCAAEHPALDHFDAIHLSSTGPELQGMVRPLVTASRSCSRPLANDAMPGRPASRAAAIHCGRCWPVRPVIVAANART